MREPTTRREIDAAIQELRWTIAGCETALEKGEEFNFEDRNLKELIAECADKIHKLRTLRESIARPWERGRPHNETRIMAYGAI